MLPASGVPVAVTLKFKASSGHKSKTVVLRSVVITTSSFTVTGVIALVIVPHAPVTSTL